MSKKIIQETEKTTKETIKVQRKESSKSKETQGIEKKQYFEISNKFEDFKERANKRIAQLETGFETLLKDSKTWQYQMNRLNVDINNKCRANQWTSRDSKPSSRTG